MSWKVPFLALGFTLFACGGSAPPAAEPTGASTNDAPPAEGAEPAEPARTAEDEREGFLKSCLASQGQEFCECGFEQFKEVFKGADLSKPIAQDDPRFAELKQKTTTACAAKVPEKDIKAGFMKGCVENDERRAKYCDCAWTSMRKRLSVADFINAGEDDARFVEPKKAMVVECKGKFPSEIAKFDFMQACTKGNSAEEKVCSCRWGKLKKQFSTEEIVAGTADVASVKGLGDCK